MLPRWDQKEGVHLTDYWRVVRKRKGTILTFFLVVVIVTAISTFKTVPVYRATTEILIEKESPNVVAFQEVMAVNNQAEDYYQTQYKILHSRSLARKVIDALSLRTHPEFLPQKQSSSSSLSSLISGVTGTITGLFKSSAKNSSKPAAVETDPDSGLISAFLGMLQVEPVLKTRLVIVSFEAHDPVLTANVANTLAKLYNDQNLEFKFAATKDAFNWLYKQAEGSREKVQAAQAALTNFRDRRDILALQGRANVVAQKLEELNSVLTKARTDRIGLETLVSQVKDYSQHPELADSLPNVMNNSLIQSMKKSLVDLGGQYSSMSKRYGEKHPQMVRLRAQISLIKGKLDDEIKNTVDSITTDYEVARAREESMQRAFNQQKAEAQVLSRNLSQMDILQQEAQSNQQLYDSLLKRLNETGVSTELKTSNIRVLDPAEVPKAPVRPRKNRNLLLSVIVGLFMGVGLAFFFEYMDKTVKSPDDVTDYLKVSFLGPVGHFKVSPGAGLSGELIAQADPSSNITEAFRNIRTNLLFSFSEGPRKVLVITSAKPEEGKSTIAANLATVIAHADKRVLLVDADLRRPAVHHIFGVKESPGLAHLLVGNAAEHDVIRKTQIPGLELIAYGQITPNPAELLGSTSMKEFLSRVRERYDYVILDTPPIMSVTDPLVISSISDGVIFVIKAGETSYDLLQKSLQQLSEVGGKVLGVILNEVNFKRDRADYPYYYQYYYEYYYAEAGKDHRRRTTRKSHGAQQKV